MKTLLKLKTLLILTTLLICCSMSASAQNFYSISACSSISNSKKFVGERLKLLLPKGAILKKGRDIDYSNYSIGFGKKKNRVWLSGIFGPTATSGQVSKNWLASSNDISQRVWKFGEYEGVDVKSKLPNGNHWRYFGQFGESIEYYDVPAEAATYFDNIIDKVCYQQ